MISAGSIGVVIVLLLLATTALCLSTGNTRRSYSTLARSDEVVVAGKTVALEQLAASYQPQLAQRAGEESPPALTMWWEAIDAGDAVALVYHPVWQDERHPDPLLHWLYYAYRAIVYGMPVRDIEYIQINISRADGRIERVRYEGSTAAAYDQPIAEHIRITIDRSGAEYTETATLPNNETRARPVRVAGPRLSFGITTWSHQFVLLEEAVGSYAVPVPMPLAYLTEENYAKHKLARRSQGDFVTREGAVGRTAKSVIRTVMLGPPYILSQLRYANTPR